MTRRRLDRRRLPLIAGIWTAVVLLFAAQWYAYDAARGLADPFRYYLWWSAYSWGVLTPLVVLIAYRHPINARTWRRTIPLHLGASLLLVTFEISVEALIGLLRGHGGGSVSGTLVHYFTRHTQASLFAYWMLVAAVELFRIRGEAQERALRASRLEAQLHAARLEVLRSQINPHFLFNTLQAAATLIHEDPDGAEDILERLGELLRASLDECTIQEIPLARELELLDLYLGIQSRRFGDRLRFEVSVDPGLGDASIPAMILQPLVENAIRHGIGRSRETDVISVQARRDADTVHLDVVNRSSRLEALSDTAGSGVGLANIRARLRQLYGDRQDLHLTDLTPTGVRARISIPFQPAVRLAAARGPASR